MQAHLRRKEEEGSRTVAEHVFQSEAEMPVVWVEAPKGMSVFLTVIEREVVTDMQEEGTFRAKSPLGGVKVVEKPKKCGICNVQFEDYEVHIESQGHSEHVRGLHEDYAKLDELLQEYRSTPARLAPIFQQAVVKRKAVDRPQAPSHIKMAKTSPGPHQANS